MISSAAAISATCLGVALVGLLVAGSRWKRTGPVRTTLYAVFIAAPAALLAEYVWELPRPHLWISLALVAVSVATIALLERDWNPPSRVFMGALIATSFTFLGLGVRFAFWSGIGPLAAVGSVLLVTVEAFAFGLLAMSAHDVLNVVGRVRWRRATNGIQLQGDEPFVSVHVATHNEPPELVLETLRSLASLEYDNYEVIVLDNNTDDPALWRPLEDFCRNEGLRFAHLENWPGFKAGALNHGLEIADERTELIAVVDSDFVVQPDFLRRTVGFFRDRTIGMVQTRQDFVTDDDVPYLRRLSLTYRTFDEVTMPSRNERESIIFAGTMGLLRKSAIRDAGGWAEWCVTEDAELSLRILGSGFSGIYVDESFGRGVMPLTFAGLKRQRFRWCFGGIQILRAHWRLLLFGRQRRVDGADLRLTGKQRWDYLSASLQWFQSLLTLFFSLLLLLSAATKIVDVDLEIRPLVGLFVAVPTVLLLSGVAKALWGLRARLKVGLTDVLAVVAIWLSLSWAVALGCIQGVAGRDLPFFRTPKFKGRETLRQTFSSTRAETPLALLLTAAAILVAVTEPASAQTAFLVGLCGWGALVFWSAPAVALAATRADLHSGALRKRRYLESIRGRTSPYHRPVAYGFAVAVLALLMVVVAGGSTTVGPDEDGLNDLFALPERDEGEKKERKNPRIADGTVRGFRDRDEGDGENRIQSAAPNASGSDPGRANAAAQAADNAAPGDQPVLGPNTTTGNDTAPGQNRDAPTPQSDGAGQSPKPKPTQAAEPGQGSEAGAKPSPKPRPTPNGSGGGSGKD